MRSNALSQVLIPTGDAVWTELDGVSPLRDIRMGINHNTTPPTPDIEELRLHQLGSWQHDAAAGQTQFYQADHLGTTRRMTTAAGQTVQYAAFTAFGEPVANLMHPTPPISRYGYVGALGYEAPVDNGFPYLHLGARWYDPETGRFLQRDPIGVAGGLNTYAYVGNNPVMLVDPAGLAFWDGSNSFHQAVASAFWMNIHSTETLASMSDGRAFLEGAVAPALLVAGGAYAYAAVGAEGWATLNITWGPWLSGWGPHFVYGSAAFGYYDFAGPWFGMEWGSALSRGIPIFPFPVRESAALRAGGRALTCLGGALWTLMRAM
jgi:RHS repeat-associated protein